MRFQVGPSTDYAATRRLLVAGMGVVYALAFLSLSAQILGLVGSDGILPNERLFARLREHPKFGFWDAPSACWLLGCSDRALVTLCLVGTAAAALLVVGVAPLPAAVICWGSYLSLFHASQTFLTFQWDTLLLEAGFLTVFLVPPLALLPTHAHWRAPPSRLVLLLFRWLLFRVMFASAIVKLSSGDPTWRDLTALTYHYETQPLPAWTSWFAHQLPVWFHQLTTLATFAVELAVPFLFFFGPRRARLLAAIATAGLMVTVGFTGNYGFFNLLTIVLCASLLDDRALPERGRRWLAGRPARGGGEPPAAAPRRPWRQRSWPLLVTATLTGTLAITSLLPLGAAFRRPIDWPPPMVAIYRLTAGLRLVNPYGLFAVMTTARPEILVEGSRDGETWRGYEFKWKPGDPARRPAFVQPHMPRLDWRMWFAALGSVERNSWFLGFCKRLLEGSPSVLDLLERNPFPESPPRYVRATLYDYRFAVADTADAETLWWRRVRLRPYVEPLELSRRGRLRQVTSRPPSAGSAR